MALVAEYEVNLYIDGTLIGDVRPLAQNLAWTRRRTKKGADEISFTLNDVLFDKWCKARGTDINTMLRPIALECRLVRDGVEVVGGFLATMPGYSPNGTSADLEMQFDGFLNLLAGVYIYPIGKVSGRMGALVRRFITESDARATDAGKAFGFTVGTISTMTSVEHTFDNYKATKEWICDRCDNVSGAGPFDVYFHADKTYDVIKDSDFGDNITGWAINYPTRLTGISATEISADEVSGYASTVIGIGAGEVSSDPAQNTAITAVRTNSVAVSKYGYFESILQESSVSVQTTLNNNTATELANVSNIIWTPQVALSGRQIAPTPNGEAKIWIGDRVSINNAEDLTGMTNGKFRVNELEVKVGATGAETITPTLERV